jgi:hypothetical protein
MNNRSSVSGHWTDQELIEHLYGITPLGSHLEGCSDCRERLTAMRAARNTIESLADDGVGSPFLSAQRKAVYTKLEKHRGWSAALAPHRWISAACALLVFIGGLAIFEHSTQWKQSARQQISQARISDAQLAEEASRVAESAEPQAAAPLRALFED